MTPTQKKVFGWIFLVFAAASGFISLAVYLAWAISYIARLAGSF